MSDQHDEKARVLMSMILVALHDKAMENGATLFTDEKLDIGGPMIATALREADNRAEDFDRGQRIIELGRQVAELTEEREKLLGVLVCAHNNTRRRTEERDLYRDLAKQLAEALEFIQTRVADTERASELVELIRLNGFPGAALAAYRAATEKAAPPIRRQG